MINRLLKLSTSVWKELFASTLLRLCNQILTASLLIFPVWALTQQLDLSLPTIGLVMVVLALTAAFSRWGEQVCGHRAAFGLLAHMRVLLYDALVRRGSPRAPQGSGSIMSIATRDINSIEVFFAHTIGPTITAIILSIGSIITLAVLDLRAGGMALIGVLIAWLLPLIGKQSVSGEASVRGHIAQHLAEDAAGRLEITSHGAQKIRLSDLELKEQHLAAVVTRQGLIVGMRQGLALLWPWIMAALMIVIVPNVGVLCAAIIVAVSPALDAVEGFARTMPTALNSAQRYFRIIDAPVVIEEPASPQLLPKGPLALQINNASLGYKEIALGTVSLKIDAGEHIGIVGPSGAGKSTLAHSILKLALLRSGTITVGGVDIADVSTAELRKAVSIVEQKAVLFKGTVLENLRMGNPLLSESEATEALQLASISTLPLDADALKLSGGQQQRVCLARALARKPRVLIVDEATSHQDALNQSELARTLSALTDTTVIIIAHRKAALTHVDRIIDLEELKNP